MSENTVDPEDTLRHSVATITDAPGSYGSTMVEDLLSKGVGGINIVDRDAANQDAMRRRIDDPRVRCFIGDVWTPTGSSLKGLRPS